MAYRCWTSWTGQASALTACNELWNDEQQAADRAAAKKAKKLKQKVKKQQAQSSLALSPSLGDSPSDADPSQTRQEPCQKGQEPSSVGEESSTSSQECYFLDMKPPQLSASSSGLKMKPQMPKTNLPMLSVQPPSCQGTGHWCRLTVTSMPLQPPCPPLHWLPPALSGPCLKLYLKPDPRLGWMCQLHFMI